ARTGRTLRPESDPPGPGSLPLHPADTGAPTRPLRLTRSHQRLLQKGLPDNAWRVSPDGISSCGNSFSKRDRTSTRMEDFDVSKRALSPFGDPIVKRTSTCLSLLGTRLALGVVKHFDNLLDRGLSERLALLAQGFLEPNGGILHLLVRLLRAAEQHEVVA